LPKTVSSKPIASAARPMAARMPENRITVFSVNYSMFGACMNNYMYGEGGRK
jgi:hypothetical protein